MLNEANATDIFIEELSHIHVAIFNFKMASLKSLFH